MGVNVDSKFHPNKRYYAAADDDDDDGLSRVPDDILVAILSFLPLKEAARTSILSSRWVNLWKHTSRLDFVADSVSYKDSGKKWGRAHTYVEWVNSVLGSLQGRRAPLKEFRISICLGPPSDKEITEWLKFALARQVERLELANNRNYCPGSKMYVFTQELLVSHHFKTLKALRLFNVRVSQEAIEFFLRNCPLLEQLTVHCELTLSNLRVISGSLKHLEIWYFFNLKSLEVSNAPNLTSLSYDGRSSLEALKLENVPMLVDSHVYCGDENEYLRVLGPALSCCISQLEILTLSLSTPEGALPQFPKLKRLVIETLARGDESLLELTSFMRACPYIQEFVVTSCRFMPSSMIKSRYTEKEKEKRIAAIIQLPHLHLKVFKFFGYFGQTFGHASDVDLVRYIFNNCVVLEKIIIDPHFQPIYFHYMLYTRDLVAERTARIYAKQLQAEIPQHVELVTL